MTPKTKDGSKHIDNPTTQDITRFKLFSLLPTLFQDFSKMAYSDYRFVELPHGRPDRIAEYPGAVWIGPRFTEATKPELQLIWNELIADTSRMLSRPYNGHICFLDYFQDRRLHTPHWVPAEWCLRSDMRLWIEIHHGVVTRIQLLKHVISHYYDDEVEDDKLRGMLIAYHHWAPNAIWDTPRPNLNNRMKQFVREVGPLYFN